jgi:hypothetical protein
LLGFLVNPDVEDWTQRGGLTQWQILIRAISFALMDGEVVREESCRRTLRLEHVKHFVSFCD